MKRQSDKIILGGGVYGLYAALYCGRRGQSVVVLECEKEVFKRATYVNQARVHMGYHYPRSLSTALKSAHYFERFCKDFHFCINRKFRQIYATSTKYSWTNAKQFQNFCKAAEIDCGEVNPNRYFKNDMCDGAFLTTEYTYDAKLLRDYFLREIEKLKNVEIKYGVRIEALERKDAFYEVKTDDETYETPYLLNTTYAGTNQIIDMLGFDKLGIKYELCEITLCEAGSKLDGYGITVMDGPFFSIMPFGKTGFHSLTAVTFTPHATSSSEVPEFECQKKDGSFCTDRFLGNCNECPCRPKTAFPYMERLGRKYLRDEYEFRYKESLFSVKPILKSSELDDSRPTVIRIYTESPTFISVLSGKVNTVYDLDEVLSE